MARAAALDWFTVERVDETAFALTEDGHWEHVNCYLFVGSDRAALVDTGTGIADMRTVVRTLVDLPIVVLRQSFDGRRMSWSQAVSSDECLSGVADLVEVYAPIREGCFGPNTAEPQGDAPPKRESRTWGIRRPI